MYTKLVSIIVVVVMSGPLPGSGQQCNRAGLQRFDEITSKATIYGNVNLKFPESIKQLQPWCKQASKHVTEAEQFNKKCNNNLFRQIYSMFTYSFKNSLKQYCKANSKVSEKFVESAKCYNKNRKSEVKCYTKWMDQILGAQNSDEKMRIPHLCCSYIKYFECTKETIPGQPGCDDNKVDIMNGFLRSYLDNVLNFICGDYTGENDKCNQLGEPPKKKKSQRRTKTISIPTADLLVSFKEI